LPYQRCSTSSSRALPFPAFPPQFFFFFAILELCRRFPRTGPFDGFFSASCVSFFPIGGLKFVLPIFRHRINASTFSPRSGADKVTSRLTPPFPPLVQKPGGTPPLFGASFALFSPSAPFSFPSPPLLCHPFFFSFGRFFCARKHRIPFPLYNQTTRFGQSPPLLPAFPPFPPQPRLRGRVSLSCGGSSPPKSLLSLPRKIQY